MSSIVTFSDARSNLKALLDQVTNDADVAVITRRGAENSVVMSQSYYDSLIETVHLLKSPKNAAHLAVSIEQYRAGKAKARELTDD